MTASPGAVDYFALEAGDCLTRIERWVTVAERDPNAPADDAAHAARVLRGAATVARDSEFARVAAALEHVLAAVASQGRRPDPQTVDAVAAAGDALRAALRASRPLPPGPGERLRAAHQALETLPVVTGAAVRTFPAEPRVVPIRTLARDGDTAFVVHRAPNPPATADQRFRTASVPLARTLRQLVGDARSASVAAGAGGDAPAELAHTLGADLRAALADLGELAESYDVRPVATFCARREAGAAALDPRTLAAVDAAAAGLLGERPTALPSVEGGATGPSANLASPAPQGPGEPTPVRAEPAGEPAASPPAASGSAAPAPTHAARDIDDTPDRGAAFRPATGDALVALLQTGISGLERVDALSEVPVAAQLAPAPTALVPAPATTDDAVIPIERLLYEGPAALERARAVRDALRAVPGSPDPTLLAELYDLLDLVTPG